MKKSAVWTTAKLFLFVVLCAAAFAVHFRKFNVPFLELPWSKHAFFGMVMCFILGLYALWLAFPNQDQTDVASKTQGRLRWAKEILLSVLFTTGFFLFWRTDLAVDDVGMALKYMDNFAKGYFYSYNPSDGPVWGVSGFIHGIVAGFFAWTHIFSPIGSLHASNFIGMVVIGVAVFRILGFYGLGTYFIFPAWATAMLASEQFLLFAKQGFETPIHLGIILFAVYFFLARQPKQMWMFFVLAVISKLDAVSIVGVLSFLYFWRERKSLAPVSLKNSFWAHLFWFAIVPGVAWLLISFLLFGSPIPQTALAKSYAGHKDQSGVFFSFLWPFLTGREVLISIILCLCAATVFHALLRKPAKGTPKIAGIDLVLVMMPLLLTAAYLLPYYFYNPLEKMGWYYVVPDFLLKFQGVVLIFLILNVLAEKKLFSYLTYPVIVSLFAFLIYHSSVAFLAGIRGMGITNLIETERIYIGKWLKANSKPTDKLFAAHGYIARYSELYTTDLTGLNSNIITHYNYDYKKIFECYPPDWIVQHSSFTNALSPDLLKGYRLLKSFYNVSTLGYTSFKVLKKSLYMGDTITTMPLTNKMIKSNRPMNENADAVHKNIESIGSEIIFSNFGKSIHAQKFSIGAVQMEDECYLTFMVFTNKDNLLLKKKVLMKKANLKDYLNGYTDEINIDINPKWDVNKVVIRSELVTNQAPANVRLIEPAFISVYSPMIETK